MLLVLKTYRFQHPINNRRKMRKFKKNCNLIVGMLPIFVFENRRCTHVEQIENLVVNFFCLLNWSRQQNSQKQY